MFPWRTSGRAAPGDSTEPDQAAGIGTATPSHRWQLLGLIGQEDNRLQNTIDREIRGHIQESLRRRLGPEQRNTFSAQHLTQT